MAVWAVQGCWAGEVSAGGEVLGPGTVGDGSPGISTMGAICGQGVSLYKLGVGTGAPRTQLVAMTVIRGLHCFTGNLRVLALAWGAQVLSMPTAPVQREAALAASCSPEEASPVLTPP